NREPTVHRAEGDLSESPADLTAIARAASMVCRPGCRIARLREAALAPVEVGEDHPGSGKSCVVAELAEHVDRGLGLPTEAVQVAALRLPVHLDARTGNRDVPLEPLVARGTRSRSSACEHRARLVGLADLEERVSQVRQ